MHSPLVLCKLSDFASVFLVTRRKFAVFSLPKVDRKSKTAFGLRRYDEARKRAEKQRQVFLLESVGRAGNASSALVALEMQQPHDRLDSAQLSAALQLERSFRKLENQQHTAREAQQRAVLQEWRESTAAHTFPQLAVGAPTGQLLSEIRPVPAPHAAVFEINPIPASRIVSAATEVRGSSKSNLEASVRFDWARRHMLIMDAESKPLCDAPPEHRCRTAGFCTCSEEGSALKKSLASFYRACKKECPARSEDRALLKAGGIVCQLQCTTPADLLGGDTLPGFDESDTKALWFHIGLMYLSPFRATLLQLSHEMTLQGPDDSPEEVLLQATRSTMRDFEAMKLAHRDLQWVVQFYNLPQSGRPTARLCPGTVRAVKRAHEPYVVCRGAAAPRGSSRVWDVGWVQLVLVWREA